MSDSEFSVIAALRAIFADGVAAARGVQLGIGDDCAVLAPDAAPLAISVDAQVEGVHFRSEWFSDEIVGYRATVAALSDLAAMGARPQALVGSLAMPAAQASVRAPAIARGQARAARAYGCAVIGGNLSAAAELSIHTTVFGRCVNRPLRRDGAQVGDLVYLAGKLGHAALGLQAHLRGAASDASAAPFAAQFAEPSAQFAAAEALRERAHAMIDVSDGLVQDARHLAHASGVLLRLDAVAIEALATELEPLASSWQLDPTALVLAGGEDYALLAAAPAGLQSAHWRVIGQIEAGEGVWLGAAPCEHTGHDHFRA